MSFPSLESAVNKVSNRYLLVVLSAKRARQINRGAPARVYRSRTRTLAGLPPIRRDLIDPRLYLVPNSIVVSRGCPHVCDFC